MEREDRDNRKILLKEGLETFQRERTKELIKDTHKLGFDKKLVSEQHLAAMAEVYIKGQQNALTDLIDFDKISEQDLKDILDDF